MKALQPFVYSAFIWLTWLLTSCVSPSDHVTQSWLGHSARDLLAAWGPPAHVSSDGRGGKVLTYEHVSGYISPGSAIAENDSDQFIVEETQTNITTRHQVFYVDPAGKIYLWRRRL